ncbi:hypothetical protein VTN49DRAFT_5412 [Thermomyces lanuginosus]|uniref:uncharacterized protein n=1 Tax=Thermomyces lanuginosus TaxID=5541 RepID=UPI003743E51F
MSDASVESSVARPLTPFADTKDYLRQVQSLAQNLTTVINQCVESLDEAEGNLKRGYEAVLQAMDRNIFAEISRLSEEKNALEVKIKQQERELSEYSSYKARTEPLVKQYETRVKTLEKWVRELRKKADAARTVVKQLNRLTWHAPVPPGNEVAVKEEQGERAY